MNFEINLDEMMQQIVCSAMRENIDKPQEALQIVLCALSSSFLFCFSAVRGLSMESELTFWNTISEGVIKHIQERHEDDKDE